jgi:hypothetical protein
MLKQLAYKISLFSFLLNTQISYSQESFPDCETCYASKKTTCISECSAGSLSKNTGKIESCKRKCILKGCNQFCGYNLEKNKENIRLPDTINCDYCTRNSKNSCEEECKRNPSETCYKRCVSHTCKSSCSLPDQPQEVFIESKSNCEECKKRESDICSQNCPNGTGSISCKVACVERKCSNECLID